MGFICDCGGENEVSLFTSTIDLFIGGDRGDSLIVLKNRLGSGKVEKKRFVERL